MGVDRTVLFRLATNERLERVVKGMPGGEALAWRAASHYVAGRSRVDAIATAEGLLSQEHGVSIDLFGERVDDPAVADQVLDDYLALAGALPPAPADVWLSVDLSHLAVGIDPSGAADRLAAIARSLPSGRRVQVGAEEAALTDAVLECVLGVAARGLADRLGATVQANLRRSPADADALADAGVHVRLVKGAYIETSGAYPYGESTDSAFIDLGSRLASGARRGQWRLTMAACGRHYSAPTGPSASSSCWVCAPMHYGNCTTGPCPLASTSPTAPTGSATGFAGLPSPEEPEL